MCHRILFTTHNGTWINYQRWNHPVYFVKWNNNGPSHAINMIDFECTLIAPMHRTGLNKTEHQTFDTKKRARNPKQQQIDSFLFKLKTESACDIYVEHWRIHEMHSISNTPYMHFVINCCWWILITYIETLAAAHQFNHLFVSQ